MRKRDALRVLFNIFNPLLLVFLLLLCIAGAAGEIIGPRLYMNLLTFLLIPWLYDVQLALSLSILVAWSVGVLYYWFFLRNKPKGR